MVYQVAVSGKQMFCVTGTWLLASTWGKYKLIVITISQLWYQNSREEGDSYTVSVLGRDEGYTVKEDSIYQVKF